MEGEQWTRTTGDKERERKRRRENKAVLEGTEAWLTWIRA